MTLITALVQRCYPLIQKNKALMLNSINIFLIFSKLYSSVVDITHTEYEMQIDRKT